MSARPFTVLASRSPCHCFLSNAFTTTTAAAAMTESTRTLLVSRRTFTSTSRRKSVDAGTIVDQALTRKARQMPSNSIKLKQNMEATGLPNDIGLFPGKLIRFINTIICVIITTYIFNCIYCRSGKTPLTFTYSTCRHIHYANGQNLTLHLPRTPKATETRMEEDKE